MVRECKICTNTTKIRYTIGLKSGGEIEVIVYMASSDFVLCIREHTGTQKIVLNFYFCL